MSPQCLRRLLLALAGGLLLLPGGPAQAGVVRGNPTPAGMVTHWVVTYSGLTAPGASPLVFDNFNYLAIAPQGEVVFRGRLFTGSNGYGLWREAFDPATQVPVLSLVQREGAPSPIAGFNFAGFPGPPTINLPGRFAFKSHVSNGVSVPDTLWVEKPAPAGLTLVAREGDPAPGVPGANFGIIFNHAGYDPLLLANSGRALFLGRLTGGGVTAANDTGLWFYDGTATTLVAREGDQMPGVPAGHFFADFLSTPVRLGNGFFIFYATDGQPVNPIRGLWIGGSGLLEPLILEGGTAPGLASDETLTLIGGFGMNRHDQVAFDGLIRKDDGVNPPSTLQGVWISNALGSFVLSARSDTAPGNRVPSVAVFTDGGHVFGVDGAGRLGRVTTSGLTIIAKPLDPAPGTAAGVQFAAIDVTAIGASSAGQVAFEASLQGPGINTTNDRGLWALDDTFQLVKVAREGDSIEAPAGVPRTITNIEFALGVGSGQPRGMSDRGEVLWRANVVGLPHGSQAVVVTSVGAPPTPRLVGLEAVQVIQNWRNEITLIDGKKTVVRAHLASDNPLRFVGQLRGFVGGPGGAELPGSPLAPANPGGYVHLDATSFTRRNQLGGGLYFELPQAWTTGAVRLLLESSGPGTLVCEEVAGPVAGDCQTTVSFVAAQVPRARFLGVSWLQGPVPQHASVDLAADLARRSLLAFPTTKIDWDFRPSVVLLTGLPDAEQTLPMIEFIHAVDGSPRRLYYGVIASELRVGTLGIANVGGWAGIGHVPSDPKTVPGRHTHTHELGHELDRSHSVHSTAPGSNQNRKFGACGEVTTRPLWPDFPNWFTVNGVKRPTLGPMDQFADKLVFGLDMDLMEVADPTRVFDLMSYCRHPRLELLPSDWTYSNLLAEINSRFPPGAPVSAGSTGDHFIVRGSVDLINVTVELHPFATLVQTAAPDPPPPGEYLLRLRGVGGTLLGEIPFEPSLTEPFGPDPGLGTFLIGVPADPAIRLVEIVHGGVVVASRAASANAPTVQVTSPNGGENFNGPTVFLQWTGSDADGDPLTYVVQYSPDNGTTWTTLGVDLTSTSVNIPRSSFPASAQGLLRVQASDGFLTAFDTSNGTFTVANNSPFVALDEPDGGRLYVGNQLVFFDALSFDPEDGNLADSRFSWTSNLNGALGTDNNFSRRASTLSPGTHLITVTATDSNGAQATDTTTIRIASQAAGPLADLAVAISDEPDLVVQGSSAIYTINADNDGPDAASALSLTFSVTLDPTGPTGPGPATILSITAPGWSCTTGSGTANCTRAALAALEESTITIQVAASQTGMLAASVQITGASEDPATGNNAAQQVTEVQLPPPAAANMSVTKTHSPASPLVGHELTYTITARNNGPDATTGVTVQDTLPAQVNFVSATASQGGCTGTSTISCGLGSLASGAQATVTIVVRPTTTGMITNTATVSSDEPDPTPGNNQATDVISMTGSNGPFAFHTVTPCRVLDTRLPDGPLGGPALGGAERSFVLAGVCGIPATARAVSANITVTGPASQGHLSLYPAGFGLPLVSSINFRAGQTRANNVTLPLGTGGAITVQAALIGGTVHFILDVNGYYE